MPGFLPRKAKPTLSIPDVVKDEKALMAQHEAVWAGWMAECSGVNEPREGPRERCLFELPSLIERTQAELPSATG